MTRKNLFILEHEESEGPGIFEPLVRTAGFSPEKIKLFRGETIPRKEKPSGVLIMGGPMNVYEEAAWPFLRDEHIFLQQCLSDRVPLLGICVGAQRIARAAAARVMKAAQREAGWYPVERTAEGLGDPLLGSLPERFRVFQFHEDTFEIPAGAAHIISGDTCPHQGFRIEGNVYRLQFHLEATQEMIAEWICSEGADTTKILADTQQSITSCHGYGTEFFLKFLSLCTG
jgi:GMP synthase (glutamine-hydrolysing)